MRRLMLAGIVFAGLLAAAPAASVWAMQPASAADIGNCLGLWVASGGCVRSGSCSPGITGNYVTNCTKYDDGKSCIDIIAGPSENTTCAAGYGSGCYSAPNPQSPCVVYEAGACETNPQTSSPYCDTALGNGQQIPSGTYNKCV